MVGILLNSLYENFLVKSNYFLQSNDVFSILEEKIENLMQDLVYRETDLSYSELNSQDEILLASFSGIKQLFFCSLHTMISSIGRISF